MRMFCEKSMYRQLHKGLAAGIFSAFLGLCLWPVTVSAASGTVYTCSITRSYSHPVSGAIEDSGGESAAATGQGMAESAVSSTGMLEVTDSGEYYLTLRMGLMDYTDNHSFQVQNVGDSGWSAAAMGITATGTDGNGATADVCLQVPGESCVVRISMYVSPMGRDVIFYVYPGNYVQGNSSGMTATMVTEESAVTAAQTANTPESTGAAGENTDQETAAEAVETSAPEETQEVTDQKTDETLHTSAETSESGTLDTDSQLSDVQGLSLSTEEELPTEEAEADVGSFSQIAVLTISITLSGLILMAVAALLVYYFRKNWYRWGGRGDEDDEDEW